MDTLLHDTDPDDRLAARIGASIERHGFAVRHVRGDAHRPSWSHSIGLGRLSHPELVVVGVTADAGRALIHWIVDLLRGGERLAVGRDRPYEFRHVPIRLVPVPDRCWDDGNDLLRWCPRPTAGLGGTGGGPGALQVVWADSAGRFPWEADFDADLVAVQPLLEHRWTRWQRG
jgi:Domain of unknown function (DUF4262)